MPGQSEIEDLYREVIIDHYQNPHHRGHLEHADARAEGFNPLCGDEIEIELRCDGGRVVESAFSGRGCAISQASASMLTDEIAGLSIEAIEELSVAFERMLKEGDEPDEGLGDLGLLQGVAKFPMRVKCAVLPWKVLADALGQISTSPSNHLEGELS